VPPSDPVGSGSLGRLARSGALFVALLGLAAVIRVGIALNIALDPDESEHLHAAWLVASGWVPFRDFWDHHAPLFFYLMAPVAWWSTGDVDVYLAGRVAMALTGAASLLVIYRLGRRFSETAARLAVLVLAFMPRFVEKTVEVRPDAPALVAWLAVILGLVRWREERRPRWLWLSGLMLGAAMALNLKAIYGAGAVLLVVAMAGPGQGRAPRAVAAALARLVGGAAIVPVVVVAWLGVTGGLLGLAGAGREILTNLRFPDFVRERPLADSAFGVLALALVGLGVVVRREGRRLLAHPVHVPLLVPAAVVAIVLLLPTTPGVSRHAWLPVVAVVGLYAGLGLALILEALPARAGRLGLAVCLAAIAVGLVIPAANVVKNALRPGNEPQLGVMASMLRDTCPGEPVLDGTALYVFRPAAYRYRTLINGIQGWIRDGTIEEGELVGEIRRAQPRLAYLDGRMRSIPAVSAFVESHYVARPDGLWVAGARIHSTGPGDGRAEVDVPAGGPYQVVAVGLLGVTIDGRPAPGGFVHLAAGRHRVSWSGTVGTITLTAATCPERRGLTVLAS
jgi:Dolichyl-phosphate-mannose-protein mannosyltransferase